MRFWLASTALIVALVAQHLMVRPSTARHSGAAGQSRVVSTLRDRVTRSGRYRLTFTLNADGRRILAGLGAAERAYRKRHPHGNKPPTIAFGVALSYAPAG